jgi:hypothetical protein
MAVGYNPKIVTDGLVLCLDAANAKSYPGTGSTWNDLSGNSNVLTATGSVTHSTLESGYFTFPGTSANYYGVDTVDFSSTTFDRTIICWFWPDSTGPLNSYTGLVKIGNSASTTPSDSILLCINTSNATTWGVASAYWANDYNPGTSLPVIKNAWNMAAIIARSAPILNNTTLICGNSNGFNALTGTSSSYTKGLQNTNTLFRVGCTDTSGGRPMMGRISKVELYNRALTVNEINQNFNAVRGRYGI